MTRMKDGLRITFKKWTQDEVLICELRNWRKRNFHDKRLEEDLAKNEGLTHNRPAL